MNTLTSISTLARQLGQVALQAGVYVATAESCTGGGLAYAITDIPGSSQWFEAGLVTYSNRMKQQMLGVSGTLLNEHGAVSEAVVEAMLTGLLLNTAAAFGVAISGIAGPDGGSPQKPVGTVCFAWGDSLHIEVRTCHFTGDRQAVREQAVLFALQRLTEVITKNTV